MIPIRYREGDPRAIVLGNLLAEDHQLVGTPCPGCDLPLGVDTKIALVYVGPGFSPESRAKAQRKTYHSGAAVALHAACAGLS